MSMSIKNKKKPVEKLVNTNYIKDTSSLYLPSENLDEADIEQIIKNPKLHGLLTAKLSNNPIGIQGVKLITLAPWATLTNLELKCCNIGPKGVKLLLRGDWKDLVQLRLGFNHIGNEGMSHLSKGPWKKLVKLWLQGNYIGYEGVQYLKNANFPKLEHLSLWENKFQAESAKVFVKLGVQNLKNIDITQCSNSNCRSLIIESIVGRRYPGITIGR